MPFLRVLRDRRGYETTYLMDWLRDGSRQRSRVLYVFRTPGGVRVGRSPFDRDTLREIEARYPGVAFDWDTVFEEQQVIEAGPPVRRRRPRHEEPGEGVPAPEAAPDPPPAAPSMPSAITGSTTDEQVAFLAQWYPVVRERVSRRFADPVRRETLLALAERLNSAPWTDSEQVAAGLEQAAVALERLSKVLARRRRRAKRRAPGGDSAPSAPADMPSAPPTSSEA